MESSSSPSRREPVLSALRRQPGTGGAPLRALRHGAGGEEQSALLARGGFINLPLRDTLQQFHRTVPFMHAVVLTTMPRGSLQAILPSHADEAIVRGLGRGLDVHDKVTWTAINKQRTVSSSEVWDRSAWDNSALKTQLFDGLNLHHHAATPIHDPVLAGYPGVLVLYREAGAEPFDATQLRALEAFGRQLQDDLEEHHPRPADPTRGMPLPHDLPKRFFAVDAEGNVLTPGDGLTTVKARSERLAYMIVDAAKRILVKFNPGSRDGAPGGRVLLADDLGDRWPMRVSAVEQFPALDAAGPVAIVTAQPEPDQWAALQPGHFPADEEVARLIPAVTFMHDNYASGPSLEDTAKVVHLSPFHFHRRFSDLLGVTPKHYLFDCQIAAAKSKLIAGEELAQIADDCGFAHQSHFTSRFKQATGLTPTRWRKLARDHG